MSPHASAELLFRIVGERRAVREALQVVESLVASSTCSTFLPCGCTPCRGSRPPSFPYTTDVPLLTRWGTPLLLGPGSIHVAHTDDEHVAIDELRRRSISTNRSHGSC